MGFNSGFKKLKEPNYCPPPRDLKIYPAPLASLNSQCSTWVGTIIPRKGKLVTKYCMFVGKTREMMG